MTSQGYRNFLPSYHFLGLPSYVWFHALLWGGWWHDLHKPWWYTIESLVDTNASPVLFKNFLLFVLSTQRRWSWQHDLERLGTQMGTAFALCQRCPMVTCPEPGAGLQGTQNSETILPVHAMVNEFTMKKALSLSLFLNQCCTFGNK